MTFYNVILFEYYEYYDNQLLNCLHHFLLTHYSQPQCKGPIVCRFIDLYQSMSVPASLFNLTNLVLEF